MGHTRERPQRLGEKLRLIRETLGLSQNGMVRRLERHGQMSRAKISEFERGQREPSLLVLLEYARAAGVAMETLVDDQANLPKKLPGTSKLKAP
jgi:transcriptional regulator with XRE-family HTH domain